MVLQIEELGEEFKRRSRVEFAVALHVLHVAALAIIEYAIRIVMFTASLVQMA